MLTQNYPPEEVLDSIYNNIYKNLNYLINNFFTPENKELCISRFGPTYVEHMFARGKVNVPVEMVAEKTGITKQSIYHTINNQRKPTFEKIVSLCDFFNVSLTKFLYTDISKNTNTYVNQLVGSSLALNDSANNMVESIVENAKDLSTADLEKVFELVLSLKGNSGEITYK